MRQMRVLPWFLLLGLFTSAACGPAATTVGISKPPAETQETEKSQDTKTDAPLAVRPSGNVTITVLYTTDEHGWLEPLDRDGAKWGGMAELLGRFVTKEHHCPGPIPANVDMAGAVVSGSADDCAKPSTILLSGGDHFTGPAISTYLVGEPMAASMARLGYTASAFGNHEFDFGRDQFLKNRGISKVQYLAANMHIADPRLAADLDIKPFQIFERKGIKIGVVGLAPNDTIKSAAADRFVGITFEPAEPSLDKAINDAYTQGADVVIVTAHECPTELVPIIAKHREWQLAFVGGGHCHKKLDLRAADIAVVSPDWRMHQYLRAEITVNQSLPSRSRVVRVAPEIIDTKVEPNAAVDIPLARSIAGWKATVDKALGTVIGYSGAGIEPMPVVAQMIADAWLAELGGDVAIMNKGGVRQTIPKGPITMATLWGVLPFDNRMMKVSITGEDLLKNLELPMATVSGAKKDAAGKWSVGKKPLDPKKRYTVLVTDFIYLGGDGAMLTQADPKPVELGMQWRDPVITWIQKQKTTEKATLESKLKK